MHNCGVFWVSHNCHLHIQFSQAHVTNRWYLMKIHRHSWTGYASFCLKAKERLGDLSSHFTYNFQEQDSELPTVENVFISNISTGQVCLALSDIYPAWVKAVKKAHGIGLVRKGVVSVGFGDAWIQRLGCTEASVPSLCSASLSGWPDTTI